jgi:quercetin dioxygenase-like cupin family protein
MAADDGRAAEDMSPLPRVARVDDVEARFGDWGPGYLAQHDDAAFGVVTLRPGDAFANHLHDRHEESFLVLDGEIDLWRDRREHLTLRRGDFVRCPPRVEHYLRNSGGDVARAFFVKAPGVTADKRDVPWTPGD